MFLLGKNSVVKLNVISAQEKKGPCCFQTKLVITPNHRGKKTMHPRGLQDRARAKRSLSIVAGETIAFATPPKPGMFRSLFHNHVSLRHNVMLLGLQFRCIGPLFA